MFFISFLFLLFSCQQDKKMNYLKTVSFNIENDVYIEGYSDADDPFLYYASGGNNKVYKYYINPNKTDSIDLQKVSKIKYFNKYFLIFNKEDYVLNQSFQIYNSVTDKLYKLDSLSNYKGIEYVIANNCSNSWKNGKILIANWFDCGLTKEDYPKKKERQIACDKIDEKKPSYSILDFKNNKLTLSKITLRDIRPKPDFTNDLGTIWSRTTSIFVNDVILYNNHHIDAVYEVDKDGSFKKAFTIKSKYTQFDKEDKEGDNISMLDYARDYATKVNGIVYDEYRDKILVILVHGTKDIEKNGEKKRENRPFSILVYDTDYNFESEYLFNDSKYNFKNVYVCKEGLIINANNKLSNNYKPQKLIYEIFSY